MLTSKNLTFSAILFSLILILTVFVPTNAQAQISQQFDTADPGRIGEQLKEQRLVPQSGPKVSVRSMELLDAPEGAEDIIFNFGGLRFEGVGIYSEDDLYPMYADKIGTEVSLADVYALANEVTLKYRNDGYVLTRVVVPPQEIDEGIVLLRAVEGFISDIQIQGDLTERERKIINDYAQQMSSGQALNIEEMERQLLLINDLAGVDARTVISPAESVVGGADMLIIVEKDWFEGSLGVNNHGSRFLGPEQVEAVTVFNSIFGWNEQITAQGVVAPDNGFELAFGFLEYKQPIGPWGTTIALNGSITNTEPGYTLSTFDVKGLSKTLGVQLEHPFIRSRNSNLAGRLGFDMRNAKSENNLPGPDIQDQIRTVRAGVQADFLDRLLGVAVNTIDLQISQGVDVFGASDEGDPNLTRAAGDPTFTKVNVQVQRLQRVTNNINVVLSGRGQIANDALLSSEEFGLGGINTIRGYSPSEVVGDEGINGTVELQYNFDTKHRLQVFSFLESGTVWNRDATAANPARESLTSTGLGVRFGLPFEVNGEVVAAKPLNRRVETEGDDDPRVFFTLNKSF